MGSHSNSPTRRECRDFITVRFQSSSPFSPNSCVLSSTYALAQRSPWRHVAIRRSQTEQLFVSQRQDHARRDQSADLRWLEVAQQNDGLIGIARHARPEAAIDIAHRLDRETSGVVILTKSVDANRAMKTLFQERQVGKVYHALVRGVPDWEEATCAEPIGSASATVELRQAVRPEGAPARTRFKVLRRLADMALVACRPLTGRTHQIRVHLEHLGFPILGDKLYGQPDDLFLEHLHLGVTERVREAIRLPRHALHARMIAFPHPVTGQAVRITAPLPPDMRAIVEGAEPRWDLP